MGRARDEAEAVVADGEAHGVPVPPEAEQGLGVVSRVLRDVLERLEAAVVDGGLTILGESPDVREIDGERHGGSPRDLAKGRREPLVGEQRRIDAVCGRAELVERVVEVGCEPREPVPEPALASEVANELELDPERDELLLHTVVEITLDLPPFRRGCTHEPPLGRAQRVHRVEQIVLQPAILERQQRGGPDGLHELGILAQHGVVDDGEDPGVAVSERAPGEGLPCRVEMRRGIRVDRRTARCAAARRPGAPADRRARAARVARRPRPRADRRASEP